MLSCLIVSSTGSNDNVGVHEIFLERYNAKLKNMFVTKRVFCYEDGIINK